ncbi:MAG: 4-hydroxy-tetrahydrodipicolinate synthase [Verrucomicrobiales bacterium]
MRFTGTYTALVTPFTSEGSIDWTSYEKLIEHQIQGGVDGVVAVGTTGESPTLDHQEHAEVVRRTVEFAGGRCRVLAGTGSNSTREALHLAKEAEQARADGLLIVAPYYNKPSQEGLLAHYQAIAEATPMPIMLYSIPSRCGVEIGVSTVAELADRCSNIVALKEAGGQVDRISQLMQEVPKDFVLLSGDDGLTLPFLSVGAQGVVSVASNLVPEAVTQLVQAALSGDYLQAGELHQRYYQLFRVLFIQPNPVPVKTALVWSGILGSEYVRAPLTAMTEGTRSQLSDTLSALSLPVA